VLHKLAIPWAVLIDCLSLNAVLTVQDLPLLLFHYAIFTHPRDSVLLEVHGLTASMFPDPPFLFEKEILGMRPS